MLVNAFIYCRGARRIGRRGPQTNLEPRWRATTGDCAPVGSKGKAIGQGVRGKAHLKLTNILLIRP